MVIEELYNRYKGHILLLCRRYIKDASDSEDVVQIVFLKAWRSLEKFEDKSGHFTWLYRIAVNECLNYLKKHRHETVEFDETKWLVQDKPFSPEEMHYLWNRILNSIDQKERSIIFLHAIEGLNISEVADVIGISRQALHKKWKSVMTKLQKSV
jgi:RNA polymerase sigma-70 factor, ECF subfamily